eukprot:scaffold41537_cov206-Amphora_coffeaeformis.AAC.2
MYDPSNNGVHPILVQEEEATTMEEEPARRNPRYEFMWWGIIRQGTDFLVFFWLFCGPLLGMVLFSMPLTMTSLSKTMLAALMVGGLSSWISAASLFWHRSRMKQLEYERNGRFLLPHQNSGSGSLRHTTAARTFTYFCLHTAMEMGIVFFSVVVLGLAEACQHSLQGQTDDREDTPRPFEFWMAYLQIMAATAIFFRYYFDVQAIARRFRQNVIPSHCGEMALAAAHLSAAILLVQGWEVLLHLAWQKNPWATPLYALEGLAGTGVVIRWSFRPPAGGEPDP